VAVRVSALLACLTTGAIVVVAPQALLAVVVAVIAVWAMLSPARSAFAAAFVLLLTPTTITASHSLLGPALLAAVLAISAIARLRTPAGASALWLILVPVAGAATHFHLRTLATAERPWAATAIVAFALTAVADRDPEGFRRGLRAVIWVSVLLALLALYQLHAHSWGYFDTHAVSRGYTSHAGDGRVAATMGHPILYGMFAAFSVALTAITRPRYWPVIVVLNGAAAAATGSRSAWAMLLVAAVIWLIGAIRRRSLHAPSVEQSAAIMLSVAAIITVSAVARPTFGHELTRMVSERLTGVGSSPSAISRENRIRFGVHAIEQSSYTMIVGHGPGSIPRLFNGFVATDQGAATLDNSYVSIWYEDGLIGLAIIAALLVGMWRRGNRLLFVMPAMLLAGIFFFDWANWPEVQALLAVSVAAVISNALVIGDRQRNAKTVPHREGSSTLDSRSAIA
jgi:hypothetical protein